MSNATAPSPRKARARIAAITTASIITFSLTLLAAGALVVLGIIPLNFLSFGQRVDVGALLLTVPVVALTLAVVFEATRIAIRSPALPDSHHQPAVNWAVEQREG
jgi:hypothetical protein